jgi:hypothetical protein
MTERARIKFFRHKYRTNLWSAERREGDSLFKICADGDCIEAMFTWRFYSFDLSTDDLKDIHSFMRELEGLTPDQRSSIAVWPK